MNLTFFGTLGVGLVMFVGVFLAFVITLLIAGLGRLLATVAMGLSHGVEHLRAPKAAKPAKSPKPARKEPQLSRDWAAAVENANARAAARAKADAAPGPDPEVSVRELPSPKAPAQQLRQVAPLVESATDRNGQRQSPRQETDRKAG